MAKKKDDDLGFLPDLPTDDLGFLPEEAAMENRGIPSGGQLETLSDMAVSVPQGITTWADEAQAAVQAGLKSPISKDKYADLYEQEVTPIRERLALARERSPIASTAAEIGTGIGTAFIPGLGAGKLSSAAGMIGRGAFEGLGTAEDKFSEEGAVQTGMGAGMGALGALVSGGVKKLTTSNPNKIRANVLGARTSEFKEIGIKEREKVAKELKDMGLFSNTKVDFDVNKGKFVSAGKSLENLEKPATDKLADRLSSATKKIQDEKMKILGKFANDPVDLEDIESALDEVVQSYSKKATGMPERLADAEKVKTMIINDMLDDLEAEGGETLTVGLLEKAKMRLSEDVGNYGKNPLLQKTPEAAQIYQNMYSSINKKLRKLIGNNKYADFNDMQQKMLTAKADLTKAIASEDASRTQAGWGGWFNKLANETLGSPEAGLGIANVSEMAQIPGIKQAITAGRVGLEEAPFAANRYLDPSIPQYIQRPQEQQPEAPAGFERPKALPSSSYNMFPNLAPKSTMITPKQMINYKIPRSTQGILDNKEMVMGKLIQNGVPDELINTIAQALDTDSEDIANIAPLIVAQFPNIFEKSKYQVFDGVIASTERAKAADAISKREDMNSVQRAKAINGINKSGKFPQELA